MYYPSRFAEVQASRIGDKFTTGEQLTGETWIDGKPIYHKVIDIGALPNAAEKQVAHGIANFNDLVRLEGLARYTSERLTLPFV
jgi:hypothetical protein